MEHGADAQLRAKSEARQERERGDALVPEKTKCRAL